MLIVPLILTSIISGVVSVGDPSALGRIGLKTMGYYFMTSLLAIVVGLAIVNVFKPGEGAELNLTSSVSQKDVGEANATDIILDMVPDNVFGSLSSNSTILQVIFFSLLFGYFITKLNDPGGRLRRGSCGEESPWTPGIRPLCATRCGRVDTHIRASPLPWDRPTRNKTN